MGATPAGQAAVVIEEPATLTARLVQIIDELCDALEDRPVAEPVAVHLRGAASPPSDGSGWPGNADVHLVTRWERALRRLERAPAHTVAVIDGNCHGASLEALLCTDYRIAVADTRLHMTSTPGGIWPGMGLYRLANQIGGARARQLMSVPGELTALDARSVGLVGRVTADWDAALAAVPEVATALPGEDMAVRRQLLLESTTVGYEEALGTHLAACDRELRRIGAWPLTETAR